MSERPNNLETRLSYLGGGRAESRMKLDKLKTLKKALLYSYQSETIVLEDGREFRALINPDKLKNDYDNKILSIPFEDICLNSEKEKEPTSYAEEAINLQVGDVFLWKDTNTYWIIYLKYLEESAYLRAEIRQCSGVVQIGDKEYRAYIRGPIETKIKWNQEERAVWNDLNYTKIAYLKEDEETTKLGRFSIIKVDGKNFQVQAVNKDTASDGIIILYLLEYFSNTIEETFYIEQEEENLSLINGPVEVHPFDLITYTAEAMDGGSWALSNSKAQINKVSGNTVVIEITSSKKGSFNLTYTQPNGQEITLPITIKSF